jgi:hypothetical protein
LMSFQIPGSWGPLTQTRSPLRMLTATLYQSPDSNCTCEYGSVLDQEELGN